MAPKNMKTCLLIGLIAAGRMADAALPPSISCQVPKAEVVFENPGRYTDIKTHPARSEADDVELLGIFGIYIAECADRLVPAGGKLLIRFSDVDYAGDFEP